MTNPRGLIPKIRTAEAQLRALKELLERTTGVTEDEGMYLYNIRDGNWFDTRDLRKSGLCTNKERGRLTYNRLKRKKLIDVEDEYRKSRINKWGREALERYRVQLKQERAKRVLPRIRKKTTEP